VNKILIKRSDVNGVEPTADDLELGELALNTNSGGFFYKMVNSNGTFIKNLNTQINKEANTSYLYTGDYVPENSPDFWVQYFSIIDYSYSVGGANYVRLNMFHASDFETDYPAKDIRFFIVANFGVTLSNICIGVPTANNADTPRADLNKPYVTNITVAGDQSPYLANDTYYYTDPVPFPVNLSEEGLIFQFSATCSGDCFYAGTSINGATYSSNDNIPFDITSQDRNFTSYSHYPILVRGIQRIDGKIGDNGDFFFKNDDGTIYLKAGDKWSDIGSFMSYGSIFRLEENERKRVLKNRIISSGLETLTMDAGSEYVFDYGTTLVI